MIGGSLRSSNHYRKRNIARARHSRAAMPRVARHARQRRYGMPHMHKQRAYCKTTYYDRPSTKRILPIVRIHAQERHLGGRQPVRAQEGGMLLPRLGAVAEEGLHNVW